MKKWLGILIIFSACTPYVPPPSPTQYIDKIAVEFTNEQSPRDFYIQYSNGLSWQNVLILRNAAIGKHIDTIPFAAGMYRIVTEGDTTNIFMIK